MEKRPLQAGELRRPESMLNRPDSGGGGGGGSVVSPQHIRVMLPLGERDKQVPVIQQHMHNIHNPVSQSTALPGE